MTQQQREAGARHGHAAAKPRRARGKHARGLILVGLFKLSKALFFAAVGAGALHLVHQNVGDLAQRLVDALHLDSEGRFVSILLDKADLIDNHHLRQAGIFSFTYAAVCVVEGTGLLLQKGWAEYFTVILTGAALPWESYELTERFSWFKVGLMVANIAVLLYLLWVLKRKRAEMEQENGREG